MPSPEMNHLAARYGLEEATCLVSGGTRGIGHAVVEEFCRLGARVGGEQRETPQPQAKIVICAELKGQENALLSLQDPVRAAVCHKVILSYTNKNADIAML